MLVVLSLINCLGCTAITSPVANGIPVRLLPPELLAEAKEDRVTIPLEWLRQTPPDVYRLAKGDILGVYIEDVLGPSDQLPPFTMPEGNRAPALGFPVPVAEDGSVVLPLVPPIRVAGLSIAEARQAVIDAYTRDNEVLDPEKARIYVALFQPRRIRVMVIRQDAQEGGLSISAVGPLNRAGVGGVGLSRGRSAGTGELVDLPAYENDVLHALTLTGGLPGLDAVNEVVVRRGAYLGGDPMALDWGDESRVTRIPLRMYPGTPRPFNDQDVILQDGDIVFIESRQSELFYTGGLLPPAEVVLPRDHDLDVVEAVIQVSGPILNAGINASNLSGSITSNGIGNPSPSLLTVIRRAPDGRQILIRVDLNRALQDPRENILVQKNDILLLQETPGEAMARYFKDTVRLNFLFTLLDQQDGTGMATVTGP